MRAIKNNKPPNKSEIKRKFNMKAFIKIMLLPISLWAACTNHKTTGFIPGVYVNHAASAYSVADDTLVITLNQGNYTVVRRTGFCRIKDGKQQAPEHRVKPFNAVWDEQKQLLQLTQNGVVLQFRPDENELLIENSVYHKIGRAGHADL
jgi:hypothetical protein